MEQQECEQHVWVWRDDKQSIYCYDCNLEKPVMSGTVIDG
jgi:hypothetical protein